MFPFFLLKTCDDIPNIDEAKWCKWYSTFTISSTPKFHDTPFPLLLHSLPDLHLGSSAILQWKSCEENLGRQLTQHLGHELWLFLQKKKKKITFSLRQSTRSKLTGKVTVLVQAFQHGETYKLAFQQRH